MEFIYPKHKAKLYIPIDLDNQKSKTNFEVAHKNPSQTLYWHLDTKFIGKTQGIHQMDIQAPKGKHRIKIIDENGNSIENEFEVINE